ncbi:hypothetical protein SAMN05428945_5388 [Streptomyces sp. 2224.1]|uniref:hypothetical protein n=1 Tax=unclassified Streptomyces TaxID=2593676 RepID=UPI0008977F3A|nr:MULTISPECIES: hypothetical protein [unclassified Streptomyces]SED31173.1 hypothetical protein SAMN05428954_0066 [Streptomyces sp. 2112.3]SED75029.1 hypothetical protein SAMN05428945_5388 [Streptomyces sp. 2224.1]
MRRILASSAVVALTACALAASPTQAATITTSGVGWKLTSQLGVTSLSPSKTYTITFATETMRKRYTPLLAPAVAQINAAGVHLKVGGVEPVNPAKCGPDYHVQITELYRPLGRAGFSQGMPCPNPPKGVGVGGIVAIDSEYWTGFPIPAHILRNTLVHEPLHALGLDHPNTADKDGKLVDYKCVATSYGNMPIMCSPNGGYKAATSMGHLTGYDLNGLKALLANARAQGIK